MFYKSHKKSSSRQFDYLYDPLYTVADYRDVQRRNVVALTRTAPLNLYTNYSDMFSDSPHRSRQFFILQRNPLPRVPAFNASNVKSEAADASPVGRNRPKYFDIPLCAMKSASVKQQLEDVCSDELKDNTHHGPQINTIGCQTVYREQSAQTRPYFPMPQLQCDGEIPEVLLVADVIKGDRVPGQHEADLVIRARKRRNWEQLLEKTPIEQNEKRLILEAFEWESWLAREEDMEKEQQERLDYVQQMLNERTQMNAMNSIGRLNESIERVSSEYERDMAIIHAKHERRLRKLRRKLIQSVNEVKPTSNKNEISLSAFTSVPSHFEKFSSQFVEQRKHPSRGFSKTQMKHSVRRMFTITQRLRASMDEIQRGFRKEYNYRLIYECLKAFRLKQVAYDEVGKLLKLLKSLKLNEIEVDDCKKRLVNLVAWLNKLEKTIEQSERCAIDVDLDLLSHRLNAILHNEVLSDEDALNQSMMDLDQRNDVIALYLEDILLSCSTCNMPKMASTQDSMAHEQTRAMLSSQEFIMNFVQEIVWPEIFKRLDQKKKRKQLMVDLKNLTSEEIQMVEEVGSECINSILGGSFR